MNVHGTLASSALLLARSTNQVSPSEPVVSSPHDRRGNGAGRWLELLPRGPVACPPCQRREPGLGAQDGRFGRQLLFRGRWRRRRFLRRRRRRVVATLL